VIKRRRPISNEEFLERLKALQIELAPDLAALPLDLNEGVDLSGKLTITELYLKLGEPQGWSLRGHCDLIGGFSIGDERATSQLSTRRTVSLSHLGTVLARFVSTNNRLAELTSPEDRQRLFQTLETPALSSGYQIVEHMGDSLATSIIDDPSGSPVLDRVTFDHVLNPLTILNERLRLVGFDRLWNDAFAAIK
jgi:hypothetical protein